MTKQKHTGVLKLAAVIIAVLMAHSGSFSESAPAWYAVSSFNPSVFSPVAFTDTVHNPNAPLQIECPEDISTYTDINECTAEISNSLILNVTEGTLFSLTWVMTGANVDASPRTGINQIESYVFNEGTTIVTYTAKDKFRNSFTCTITVIISDNQVPKLVSAPENITVSSDDNECGALVSWTEPDVIDNCTPSYQIKKICSHVSGSFFPVGTTKVSYILDDGMATTQVVYPFTVTVTDRVAPVLTAPENITLNCGDFLPRIYSNFNEFIAAGGNATDNCNIKASSFTFLSQKQSNPTCPYTLTRTYQISDVYNNIGKVEHLIFVGEEAPKAEIVPVTEAETEAIQPGSNFLKSGMGIESSPATYSTPGTYTFTPPAGVTSVLVQAWGGGGGGGSSNANGTQRRAGGGGGGGGFTSSNITVTPGNNYTVVVGAGGTAGNADDGGNGGNSTFNTNSVIANGGRGGERGGNGAAGTGAANGSATGTGTVLRRGGNGTAGQNNTRSGAGGGGAGTTGNGGAASGITGGTGTAIGGGNGANGLNSRGAGNNGNTFGGGGSGGYNTAGQLETNGGAGANGQVIITWTCPTYALTSAASATSVCVSGTSTVTLTSTSLPDGTYTVTYSTTNPVTTGNTATMVFNGSTGTFTTISLSATSTITVTSLGSGTPPYDCTNAIGAFNTATVNVSALPTITLGSNPSVCRGMTTANLTYSAYTGSPNQYSIDYDATANAAAFTDVNNASLPASPIVLTVPAGAPAATYNATLTIRNGGCISTAYNISVTVKPLPVITTQPAALTICENGSGSFVVATSASSPTYQWQYSTNPVTVWTNTDAVANLSGHTTNTLSLINAPLGYSNSNVRCIVTSNGCSTISNVVLLTVNPTNTVTRTSAAATTAQTVCINTPITNITYATTGATGATVTNLPTGVTGSWAGNVVTISGTPTVAGAAMTYTVTLTGGCGTVTTTGTIAVTANNTVTRTSAAATTAQTVCINTPITNITYATTGATGATVTNLPTGVTGSWAGNVVTISGTPTASGTFNYSISLTGGCGNVNATGTIVVTPDNTITLTSAVGTDGQTVCILNWITDISYNTTGATGATFSGLPTGVAGTWNAGVITISGIPSVSGTFNYTITLTGGCGNITQNGSIRVNPDNTITLTSAAGTDNQDICINTPFTDITYATTGATGATFTGLPAGVTGGWAANVATISGTPTVSGNFTYNVNLTGNCGTILVSGTVNVDPDNTISLTSGAGSNIQTTCFNNAITDITYSTTGATGISNDGVSGANGLPAGISSHWVASTITISGSPTASGTFNYSIPLTGGCGNVNATGTISVTPTVGTPTAITVSAGTEPTCQLPNGTTTTTYSTTATNNTGFNWSLSNAAAGSINASGVMTWANGFTGSVDIQVTASGCNGPSIQVTRTVFVSPTVGVPSVPTPSATTICQGSANTSYTTLASNATSYNWTVTGAGNIISGTGTTGTVTWAPGFSGIATISVTANGCNGPSAAASTTVNVLPTPTATISGTTSVCQNTSSPDVTFTNPMSLPVTVTYNINGGSNQTINIAASATNTVVAPTNVVGPFVYNLVSVEYQSAPACSNAITGSATVTVRPEAPATPGAITGNVLVLPASMGNVYSIAAVANATTYTWTVPTGWTITAGQGTTSVTVTSGTATQDGNITVTAVNDCGTSAASILAVLVDQNLAIVTDPRSQSECYYRSVLFEVTISGGGSPITYTWERNTGSGWANIVGDPDVTYPSAGSMLVSQIGSATNPGGTLYRVIVTDAGGTSVTSNAATLTVNRVATMTGSLSTTICEGQSVTYIATTQGETPISMQWEKDGVPVSGATSTTITVNNALPSDAGRYRLSVVFPITTPNNNGGNPTSCTLTSTLYRDLVVNPLPVLAGPSEVCTGQTINWTPNSGGTWISNNPAVATITNAGVITGITAGSVTFTFTETATGCSSTSPAVTVHPLPTGVISDNTAICAGLSANFTVTLTGTAPWSLIYSDGTTPVTVSGINASPYSISVSPASTSTYTLTAVSDANCDATSLTGSAVVTILPLPTATLSGNTTICIGSSANLSVALTGAQPWTITYTDGTTPVTVSGINVSPYTIPVTPVATTTYSLTAVSDANCTGTSLTGNATIAVDNLPTASAGGSQNICVNGTATISGATAANGTILWTENGTGSITAGANTLTPTYTPAAGDAGNTVTLTMTVTSNNACGVSTATATYTVTVDPLPTATAGGNQNICSNGTATVSGAASTNGTILWSHNGSGTFTGATTLTPDYTAGATDPGNAVILTMTVTSNNGCTPQTATAVYTVNVLPEPQVNQPSNQEICTGSTTTMINFSTTNVTGSTTYSWTNSEPTIGLAASGNGNIIPFTVVNNGNAPVVATIVVTPHLTLGGITCDGPAKTFTITVNPVPVATAPIGLTYCNGILSDPFALTGTPSGVVFDISGGAAIGLANVNGVTEIPAFTPITGTATITMIPKSHGCTGFPVTFNINVRPNPTATISGGATVCQNSVPPNIIISNPMTLTVVVTYNINGAGGFNVNVPAGSNVAIGVPTNTAGTFIYDLVSVQYLATEPPTCPAIITGSATINVVAQPVPVITGPTNICAETTANVYSTQAGMSNYAWSISAGGTITAGGTSSDNTVTVTWTTGGSHNVSVGYTNASGCSTFTPTVFPVNVYALPTPTITGSTSSCLGATNKIYSTQPGMSNYQWAVSAGGTITAGGTATSSSVTVTWTSIGPQTISVNYRNANGCTASAAIVKNIIVNPLPVPTLGGPNVVCAGATGNVYTTEAGMSSYVWTVSAGGTITSGGTSNSSTATVRWNTDGPQTISVSYTNSDGCIPSSPTSFAVTVNPKPVPTITGPTSVCIGSTGNIYITEAGMSSYTWTIAAGGTITAGGGAGDNTVTVSWTTAGAKTVKVNYANASGCIATTPTTSNVTVNALPTPAIAGPTSACVGSTDKVYTTVAGMSDYQWSVSAGGTITSGGTLTDNEVTVTWNTAGAQTVSLNYTNTSGCAAATATVRNVTVNPLPTPTIAGPVTGCTGGAVAVYTTQAGMTGYSWNISAGGTITAGGSGTDNTVTVVWNNAGAQTVSVNYYNANSCTAVTPTVLNVNVLAPATPTCPVYADVCSNTPFFNLAGGSPAGGVYSGPGVTFVGGNYRFTPATAGAGTHAITYTLPNVCADYCTFNIVVKPTPVGSASAQTICSGDTTSIVLNSTVPGTTYTWTAANTAGTVTGFSNCAASCDTVIRQVLTNTSVRYPGSAAGTNGVVTYTVTATKDGCSSTFTVSATVRPDIRVYNLTWNSNFMEDYIEVCAGTDALSDNDIEIAIPPFTLVPANHFSNGGNWNPVILYGPTPDGPWTVAAGGWHGNYEWNVDLAYNNILGYHYFVLQITDPVTGCVQYSNPAILNVVSSLTVDAAGPDFMCGVTPQTLTGAYVGGISTSGTTQGRWSITSLVPANGGNNGTLSSTALTSNPQAVTYTPPAGYIGTVTLTLTTNDPDGGGTCVPITDIRTITIVPPNSFTGCFELANWPVSNSNSNGTRDDSNEPCFVTIVGGDNLSGTPGTTDITRCSGTGTLTFDWSFSAPQNKIVWHQEDQKVGSNNGTSRLEVAPPSNISIGDLIIVTIHENNNTGDITTNLADGFTLIKRDFIASQVTVASLYKIATAADVGRTAVYQFNVANNNASGDDRIYSSRITGHNTASPIGNSSGVTQYLLYPAEGYMTITIPSVNTTASNSMLVTALAININGSTGNDVEYINSPLGSTTMYYNDIESTSRVAQEIITSAGATGGQTFQWPSYNTRNRSNMYTAAQMFVINPATNETDDSYYLLNGVPTLLGNTNGASGSVSVAVESGDVVGFRAGTSTNTGGPGRLTVYNLTMPNDAPVLTGNDTIFIAGCQDAAFVPTFVDPTVTDDCDTPVLKAGYPVISAVDINGCDRSQTKTWIYVDDCGEESLPFVQTAIWYVSAPLSISCPIDPELPACTDPAVITSAYDIWKAGFVANGGCDVTTNIIAVPPLILGNIACGDTLTFKFIATDVCGQKDSCTSTFTVQPLTVLDVNCPADPLLPACTDNATITTAYNTWKAGFTYSGGCAAVTDNIADIPALTDLTCGGQLSFIYTVENSCGQSNSCFSNFTVAPLTELEINVPPGVSLPICTDTADIRTAYNIWKAGFTTSGGCSVITNIASFPALTDLSCGGTLSFTFTAENGLASCVNQLQETSTFTVADAPELTVSCPVDPNIAGCLGIQAITDAYDTWVDGFKAFGGCNVTTNIASIPPLGSLICNGQLTFTFIADNGAGGCSDHAECTSTFTIGAASPIVVNVPADLVLQGCNTNQAIIDAFNAWKGQFGYTGGCNVSTTDLSAYTIPSSCGGTVTIEYTASDECGQSETRSASFTLNPEVLTVSCPGDEVQAACQNQAAIDAAFAAWKAQFTFSGGCGTVATDLSVVSAPNACGGTVIVNYTATDICGQVSNCSAIFAIDAPSDVLQEPSFTNPADITVYRDANCNYSADPTITGIPLNLADNCGAVGTLTISYADSIVAGTCINELIIYRRWTVADECLNRTTKTQIVTVTDNIAPVIVCAPDVNGIADNSECEATGVNLGTTTATDNCLLASLTGVRSDGFPITDPFPVGITTITWTATDACGNFSTCIQTVNMIDGINQPPTITCPADVVQTASANFCYLDNVVIPNPVADDNCEVATISWIMSGATVRSSALNGFNYAGGETFNVGVTTVTYMATDSAGNFATCAFTVTILDVTPPSIDISSCANVSDVAAPNNCSKIPATLNDPTYIDSCWPLDSLVLRWTMTGATIGNGFGTVTDSAFNVGVTNVTYYVTDPDGNEDNCNFTVTIHDVTPPSVGIAGCEDVTDVADPNNCAKVPGTFDEPVYADNCWPLDSLDLTYTITGATTGSGSGSVTSLSFNVGVSVVTYTVTDPDNNAASCSFTVTIVDVTPPVVDITNCVDVSDVAALNNCSKIPAALEDPIFSDTCWPTDSLTLSWTMTGATTGSGLGTVTNMAFNVGVTNVVYTISDPDGNEVNCSFTVTILDVTPPSVGIAGCEDVTDITDALNCTVIPDDINDPVYSDSCWPIDSLSITWAMTGATIRTGSGSVVGESFNAGITTVTYTVTDPDNNTANCSFTVTIVPFNPPLFTAGCPPNVTETADPGVCDADLIIPVPTVNDPCLVGYIITNDRTGTDNASGIYPVGTTLVHWTITPTVGTPTTCTQTVIVTDDEDPIITTCAVPRSFNDCSTAAVTGPAISTTIANSTYAEFSGATNLGVATDNCGIVTVTYIDVASGSCPINITRTWTLFDAAGNSATCDQTITVSETIPPVVDCPANDTIPSDFNQSYSDYSIPGFGFSDNCTDSVDIIVTWTLTGVTTGSGSGLIPAPYRFNVGLTTISYTFTDACGNTTNCVFTLYVLFPPDIDCLLPKTYNTDPGVCTHRLPTDVNNPGVPSNSTGETINWEYTIFNPDGSSGDTGSSTGVSPNQIDPYDFWLGNSIIRWVGINASGTDTCTQQITVIDVEPPTFAAVDFEDCVERLTSAVYTGDADNIQYNPDYPDGDYKILHIGDTYLDIDLNTYLDNCCVLADGYSIRWTLDFEGTNPGEPTISGTGQPSTYKDPVTSDPLDIYLWGDGVTFLDRVHTITYWMTDCHGNESLPVTVNITINPRPELVKMN